ncbi:MAG: hypothetical protein AB9879_09960 [Methanothrix sp.]
MKKIALLLAALICLQIAVTMPAMALSDTDKAVIKLTTYSVLDDTNEFNYVSADLGRDNSLSVWYIPKKTDQESTMLDLAYIIGAYWGVCKNHPDISDLNLFIGTKDSVAGTLYCKRSWINEIKTNSAGAMETTSAGLLVLQVLGTFQKT